MFRRISTRLSAAAVAAPTAAAAASAEAASATTGAVAKNKSKNPLAGLPRALQKAARLPRSPRGAKMTPTTISEHNDYAEAGKLFAYSAEGKARKEALPAGAAELQGQLMQRFIGGPNTAAASSSSSSTAAEDAEYASTNAAVVGSAPSNSKFAIVMVNNIQYKVSVGDVIAAQRLSAAVGSRIALKKVLLVGGPRFTAIGRPLLANCRIVAEVEEHKRMKGTMNFVEYKGRHQNKFTYNEHAVTMLRIVELSYNPEVVGEVSSVNGTLIKESQREKNLDAPSAQCYYAEDLPEKAPLVANAKSTAPKGKQ